MNTNMLLVILIAVLGLLFIAVVWATIRLKQHGINSEAVIDDIGEGITYAQSIATAMSPFLPKLASATINLVLKVAAEATQRVEATHKAALSADAGAVDTRSTEAKSLITSGLALKGITVTDDINKLIDAVVPVLVLALPKTHAETAGATTSVVQ
jgi:hypothetical protein